MTYLAVFDWNGTLFDDTAATLCATNACMRFFERPEIDLPTLQDNFTFPLIHFYEKMGVSADRYLAITKAEASVFLDTYNEKAKDCVAMNGAVALLDWLTEKSVRCMVLSNHLQHHLNADIARSGLAKYMEHIAGVTDRATIVQGLSKQIRLDAYMKDHGVDADKVFIIGDSHEEAELAKRLGILGIGMTGGLTSRARLEKYGAGSVVDDLSEVRPILEKHWNL